MRNWLFSAIFTSLLGFQYIFAKSISFSIQQCKLFQDFRNQMVFTCMSNIYIGIPKQKEPMSFILSNPLSLPIADTMNFVFNTKCSLLNKCKYAESVSQNQETPQFKFFNEKLSISLQTLQKNYTKDLDEYYVIQGDLELDNFYLSLDDQPIQLEFISVYNFTQAQYVGNGFINLVNGNKNGIFIQGYLQNKLISPIFQFGVDIFNAELLINYNITSNSSYPIVKTYSSNNWDVQMTGLVLDDTDMISYAHYQTFIIQTYVYSAIPKNIAKYLQSKYTKYFSNSYNILQNCDQCECASDLPSLEVYTSQYKISIPFEEFLFTNSQGQCEVSISSSNLLFGIRQILFNSVIFNPLEGELQFPGAELMIHPSIDWSLVILIQSNILFAMVFALLVKYERYSTDLKLETSQFDIRKYINQQIMVKKEVQ
ncbi:hypothetical protein ABPG74_012366 [Tetrahymena malaccensis]